MALSETGSNKFSANKKDLQFVLKLAGYAIALALLTVGIEQIDVIKSLIPSKYAPLITGILLPLVVWVHQFVTDARKKLEDDTEDEHMPPPTPMVMIFLALALSFPGSLIAQVTAFEGSSSTSPLTFKPFTLVRLACEQEAKSYVWILRRMPDGYRPDSIRIGNGKELVFTGPPGSYDVDTIYSDETGTLQQVFVRVVIEGTDGVVPVPPVPGPIPPPTPDGIKPLPKPTGDRFGFGPVSYDLALEIPGKDRVLAEQIADNYGSVSAAIFAGGIVDVNQAFTDLRSRNQALATNPAFPAWKNWFDKLGFKVTDDWNNKKFMTRSDIAEVFREIQVGLLASIGKKPE